MFVEFYKIQIEANYYRLKQIIIEQIKLLLWNKYNNVVRHLTFY